MTIPPRPEPNGGEYFPPHLHLDHRLLLHLSQVMYEAIDETILLPADWMPDHHEDVVRPEDEELYGVTMGIDDETGAPQIAAVPVRPTRRRPAGAWWEDPRLQAAMALFPQLRSIARLEGIDGIFRWAAFTDREADAYSMDAAGYTAHAIAERMNLKEGGVENLLDAARGKVVSALRRMEQKSA